MRRWATAWFKIVREIHVIELRHLCHLNRMSASTSSVARGRLAKLTLLVASALAHWISPTMKGMSLVVITDPPIFPHTVTVDSFNPSLTSPSLM